MRGINPWSRIPKSKFRTLDRVRQFVSSDVRHRMPWLKFERRAVDKGWRAGIADEKELKKPPEVAKKKPGRRKSVNRTNSVTDATPAGEAKKSVSGKFAPSNTKKSELCRTSRAIRRLSQPNQRKAAKAKGRPLNGPLGVDDQGLWFPPTVNGGPPPGSLQPGHPHAGTVRIKNMEPDAAFGMVSSQTKRPGQVSALRKLVYGADLEEKVNHGPPKSFKRRDGVPVTLYYYGSKCGLVASHLLFFSMKSLRPSLREGGRGHSQEVVQGKFLKRSSKMDFNDIR
eukprot:CAMPEP_0185746832 /NCGR_PEP_ID=MMETSP1174-20130828/5496_1 /TAXON_ID=35687 /ORGANISM="Dictyocha speculum, Strain CCMP1381" /LENGTH=282 /DNA_ID=CAMNT_0028421755 /DNA_START=102 /DNA_END=945 /DNA_ORIENTATION=-